MTEKQNQTNTNVQDKAAMIWNIADIIRGTFKPHEYGKIILPMTLLKRLNDTLLPTKEAVMVALEETKQNSWMGELKEMCLTDASGLSFYNTSPFTFESLLDEPDHIEENFNAFLAGFSENIQDIIRNFRFENTLKELVGNSNEENKLFYVIQEFNKPNAYMGADLVSTTDMGYIFEELVRKFSESYNEEAGAHFTARDIIYTMTDLLLLDEGRIRQKPGELTKIYDMTMGTSQMLTAMEERLTELDEKADVCLFGQEINPETFAIAKADTIIRGGDADNMRFGDTLSNDRFRNELFDYIISNPPFGIDWKSQKQAVEAEHKLGANGRFHTKLPSISDGQMLFTLNGIKKLKDNGKMAIIHNGSPLFSGDAESGPSEIRRHIIENDWLEAIIQLPSELFYNTGITTYIWIINKNKSYERKGKVQLIDASKMFEKKRKSLGCKRVELTEECRNAIVLAYGDNINKLYEYDNKSVESKVLNNEDFGYYKITVETPLYDEDGNIVEKKGKKVADTSKRDTENVPMIMGRDKEEVILEYFEREVLPYNKDAWIDNSKTKIGYEIPFTRLFYKYVAPEKAEDIANRIIAIENELIESLSNLFGKEL